MWRRRSIPIHHRRLMHRWHWGRLRRWTVPNLKLLLDRPNSRSLRCAVSVICLVLRGRRSIHFVFGILWRRCGIQLLLQKAFMTQELLGFLCFGRLFWLRRRRCQTSSRVLISWQGVIVVDFVRIAPNPIFHWRLEFAIGLCWRRHICVSHRRPNWYSESRLAGVALAVDGVSRSIPLRHAVPSTAASTWCHETNVLRLRLIWLCARGFRLVFCAFASGLRGLLRRVLQDGMPLGRDINVALHTTAPNIWCTRCFGVSILSFCLGLCNCGRVSSATSHGCSDAVSARFATVSVLRRSCRLLSFVL